MAAPRSAATAAAAAAAVVCIFAWVSVAGAAPADAAADALDAASPPPPPPPKQSWPLLGNKNESQQKHLNPQLLAYFLRPLAGYLQALSAGATGGAAAPAYDDYGAPSSLALTPLAAPALPPKLSLLASLFGWGANAGPVNPSYSRSADSKAA